MLRVLTRITLLISSSFARPAVCCPKATVHAAELIGWPETVGAIAPGRYADIIAVDGNPLEDVNVMEQVSFVMKDGAIFKD